MTSPSLGSHTHRRTHTSKSIVPNPRAHTLAVTQTHTHTSSHTRTLADTHKCAREHAYVHAKVIHTHIQAKTQSLPHQHQNTNRYVSNS